MAHGFLAMRRYKGALAQESTGFTVACSSGISWMVAVNLFTRNISNESKHDAPAATWQLTAARLQSDLARLCVGDELWNYK